MRARKPLFFIAAAAAVALAICQVWKPVPYVEQLIRIQADQELGNIDKRIMSEPIEVQGVLLDYAGDKELVLKAWIALSRYPEQAREILLLYGSAPEFKTILRNFGEAVIPVIQYFRENEVWSITAMDAAGKAVQRTKDSVGALVDNLHGRAPANSRSATQSKPDALDPTQRGWYAINLIGQEGHDLLGQFVVSKDHAVKRIQTDRFFKAITSFFTSGFRTLETKHDLGENITAGDAFWAGLDVAVIAAPLKLFRAGKAVARSGEEVSLAARTRLYAPRLVSQRKAFQKLGKYGAAAATAYIVATHPGLINSVLGEVATLMGLSPWLVQFVVWSLIITIVLYPFSWLLKALARSILFGLSWLEQSRRRSY